MKISPILPLLAVIALFAGCASVTKQAINVYPEPKPDKGLVYFYREKKFAGSAVSYNIKENGEIVGAIANGTYFFLFPAPGTHTYTASTEADSSRTVNVEGGKIYYIEAGVDFGILAGRPALKIASEAEAKSVLPGLTYATK